MFLFSCTILLAQGFSKPSMFVYLPILNLKNRL